MTQVHIIKLAE